MTQPYGAASGDPISFDSKHHEENDPMVNRSAIARYLPHPAIGQLMRTLFRARLSHTWQRFRSPRRLMLSGLALLLTMVWFGQVLLGVVMRKPANPEKLVIWIALGLLAYTIWHVLKATCRTPIEPFEWTPAERELLMGAPLRRYDLVMLRVLTIAGAATVKATCFVVIMLPDLHVLWAAWFGMLLALLFVDLLRMGFDIFVYGLSRREFLLFRVITLSAVALVLGVAVMHAFEGTQPGLPVELPISVAIPLKITRSLLELRTTAIGKILEWPYHMFANVILAPHVSLVLVLRTLAAFATVVLLIAAVVWLERRFRQRRVNAERTAFLQRGDRTNIDRRVRTSRRLSGRVPPRLAGVGSLAWRQFLGALHYRTSLCLAMIIPGVLSCLTLLTPHQGSLMLAQLVGGLVFYSFLLLPTAFKFDFRRDIDRMAVLKSLPLSPLVVTCGQLAMPVLLCTLFQLSVLLFAMAVRPYSVALLLAAILVLLPVNIVIFALENLIFLLYPYRLQDEGIGVFLRSILTFTGKTFLFVVAIGVTLLWAVAAQQATQGWSAGWPAAPGMIFAGGLWLLVTGSACAVTAALVTAYRRFDPSRDTPAG